MKRSFLKREKAAGTLPRGAGPEEQTQYSINRKKRPEFKREKLWKSIDRRGSACYPADRADVRDIRILADHRMYEDKQNREAPAGRASRLNNSPFSTTK
jgi:hypothetical protein